jgi:hypothetical protein
MATESVGVILLENAATQTGSEQHPQFFTLRKMFGSNGAATDHGFCDLAHRVPKQDAIDLAHRAGPIISCTDEEGVGQVEAIGLHGVKSAIKEVFKFSETFAERGQWRKEVRAWHTNIFSQRMPMVRSGWSCWQWTRFDSIHSSRERRVMGMKNVNSLRSLSQVCPKIMPFIGMSTKGKKRRFIVEAFPRTLSPNVDPKKSRGTCGVLLS